VGETSSGTLWREFEAIKALLFLILIKNLIVLVLFTEISMVRRMREKILPIEEATNLRVSKW